MSAKKFLILGLLACVGIVSIADAQELLPRDNGTATYYRAPRWRESEGHPLRVLAWVANPIGWIAREAVFRPISYMTSSTPFTRSFFGYREPFAHREPYCFSADDSVPDCHKMPPLADIGSADQEKAAPTEEKQIVFPDINFEFDKATLNSLGKARVRQVAQILGSVPSLKIVVEGHTDYMGTDQYNMKLGARRAATVIKELSELGIDSARMSPISYGESRPLYTEQEDWARAANRRVQFTVNNGAEEVASAAPQTLGTAKVAK